MLLSKLIDDHFFCIKSSRDEATQLVALKLVNSMLHGLKPTELLYLLPSVKTFSAHPSPACREVMYDILMWVYDNYRYVLFVLVVVDVFHLYGDYR